MRLTWGLARNWRAGLPSAASSRGVFLPLFVLYSLIAVLLLVLGLLPYLVSVSAVLGGTLSSWGEGQGLLARVAEAIAKPADGYILGGTGAVVRDYFFSLLNLVFGIFIVWRRPNDWVARLLGLGMVGTAVAYNFYAHEAVFRLTAALPSASAVHLIFHGAAGTAYLHALLLFPNGVLVPRWSRWFLPPMYLLMLSIVGGIFFSSVNPPTETEVGAFLTGGEGTMTLDALLVIFFFGAAIPAAGVLSQVYRPRALRSLQERQQAKLVVWALCASFAAGLIFLLIAGGIILGVHEGFSKEAIDHIEGLMFQVFPPLFSIIPIALFVAIVRYRLFNIDLLINRTVVYAPLTAVVSGLIPAAVFAFKELLSALIGGDHSDVAIIFAFLLVLAIVSPLRGKLQAVADRYFRPRTDPAKRLYEFSDRVHSVVQVMDLAQMARRLLDEATDALGADRGAVSLQVNGRLHVVNVKGEWDGIAVLSLPLESNGLRLGSLSLGPRANGPDYTEPEVNALRQATDVVAHAMGLIGEEQWRKLEVQGPLVGLGDGQVQQAPSGSPPTP